MTAPPLHLPVADLLDILPDAVVVVDARGRIAYVNPSLHTLLGWYAGELVGQPLSLLVPPASREQHERLVERYGEAGPPKMMGSRPVLHAQHRSGHPVPVSIALCNLGLEGGRQVSVAVLHGVASLHTPLDHATRQAQTDALTGIGNRLALSRRLQGLLAGTRGFGLLRIALTQVPPSPPSAPPGTAAGEADEADKAVDVAAVVDAAARAAAVSADEGALRIAALRLRSGMREGDLAARLGGNEFVLLGDGIVEPARLRTLAERCLQRLAAPLRPPGGSSGARLAAHIGGAIYPRHGLSEWALLAAAGRALDLARHGEPPGSAAAYRLADD
ncbi:MAG: PAS domain-containing protein [Burkholderiales bacterium]|nr:PAS domain-containing protein [Burkholderiales bacterium]